MTYQGGVQQFIRWGGWVISIAVGAILAFQYLQSPVQAVNARVDDIQNQLSAEKSTNDVQNTVILNIQGSMKEIKENVTWIRNHMVTK